LVQLSQGKLPLLVMSAYFDGLQLKTVVAPDVSEQCWLRDALNRIAATTSISGTNDRSFSGFITVLF